MSSVPYSAGYHANKGFPFFPYVNFTLNCFLMPSVADPGFHRRGVQS